MQEIKINAAGQHPLLAEFQAVRTPEHGRDVDWTPLLRIGATRARLCGELDGLALAELAAIATEINENEYEILWTGFDLDWLDQGPDVTVHAGVARVSAELVQIGVQIGGQRDFAGVVYKLTEGEVCTVVIARHVGFNDPINVIKTTWRLLPGAPEGPTWAPVCIERDARRHQNSDVRTVFRSIEAIVDPELFVLDHNRRLPPHDAGWGQPSRLNLERSAPPARLTLVKAELGNEDQGWKAWVVKLAPHDCPFTTADALCWPRHLPLIDVSLAIKDALNEYADDKHGLLTERLEPPPDDADGALWCAIAYLRACADDTLRFRPSERRGFDRVADELTARKHYTRPDRAGLQ